MTSSGFSFLATAHLRITFVTNFHWPTHNCYLLCSSQVQLNLKRQTLFTNHTPHINLCASFYIITYAYCWFTRESMWMTDCKIKSEVIVHFFSTRINALSSRHWTTITLHRITCLTSNLDSEVSIRLMPDKPLLAFLHNPGSICWHNHLGCER